MALKVRELSAAEREAVRHLAHSRTAPAREVERARMMWHLLQGERVPGARRLQRSEPRVRYWLKQFNALGLVGLQEQPRPGRPPEYSPEQVAMVSATALTPPADLRLPFACWSLDRLQHYLRAETGGEGIRMKRSRLDEVLLAEGLRWRTLRWRTQESWFGVRVRPVDPEFAQKRGSSNGPTQTLRPAA